MISRFLLFMFLTFVQASEFDISTQVNIAAFGLIPADYSPYERVYLNGQCDYHTVINNESQVVYYVPKTPEVLEVFCDELIEEAKNRSLNPEVFSAKVGVVRAKGCVTELDIRDLFLDLSVSVSTPDDCTKVWGIFSGEFLLNYQFVLTQIFEGAFKQIDFQMFWESVRIKLDNLIKLEILSREDLIKSEGERLNGMISEFVSSEIMLNDELYVKGLRLFDKVLRIANDIEKIINEDILNFKQRYEETFKIQIRVEELLKCANTLEVYKYLAQNTFLYLFPNYLLFDTTIKVDKEKIGNELKGKTEQKSKRSRDRGALQKIYDKIWMDWINLHSEIRVPNDGETLTPLEKCIEFIAQIRKFDDFMAGTSKKLGISFQRNKNVCYVCENQAEKQGEEVEHERQQALAELGLSPEDLHPKEKGKKKKLPQKHQEEELEDDVEQMDLAHTENPNRTVPRYSKTIEQLVKSSFGLSVAAPAKQTENKAKPATTHPKGSQQTRAADRRAAKALQRTEAAMASTVEPKKKQKGFQLFERPQPKVRDYVAMARIKASKLPPVQRIPYEFFHQEKQYKFDDYVNALRSYSVEFLKHPYENKIKVCFKGTDGAVRADEGWIDIAHDVQNEKSEKAGWFLRPKQFLQKHAAVAKKQAKEAKEVKEESVKQTK